MATNGTERTLRYWVHDYAGLPVFIMALASSVALLWTPEVRREVSLLPIAAYGAILALLQRLQGVTLTPTVKDSPYFLGFIITMVGLFRIFKSIPSLSAATEKLEVVAPEAAVAILATVIGLFFRQLLWSRQSIHTGEFLLEEITQRLSANAGAFASSQAQFASLLTSYIDTHKAFWEREQAALERYVTQLDTGAALLSKIEHEYPERIAALVETINHAANDLGKAASSAAEHVHDAGVSFTEDYRATARVLLSGMADTSRAVTTAGQDLHTALNTLRDGIQERTGDLNAAVEELTKTISVHSTLLDNTAQSLARVSESTSQLDKNVQAVTLTMDGLDSSSRTVTETLARTHQQVHEEIVRRADIIRTDLREIDSVVDDFVTLMKERIQRTAF